MWAFLQQPGKSSLKKYYSSETSKLETGPMLPEKNTVLFKYYFSYQYGNACKSSAITHAFFPS